MNAPNIGILLNIQAIAALNHFKNPYIFILKKYFTKILRNQIIAFIFAII